MSCDQFQSALSLYVEGDLQQRRARRLEAHLRACSGCRVLLEQLRENQNEIRQLRSEILDTASLHRIRANVLAEIQAIEECKTWLDRLVARLWGMVRPRYAVAGCVALVISAAILWRFAATPAARNRHVDVPIIAEVHHAAPLEMPSNTERARDVLPRRVRSRVRHPRPPATAIAKEDLKVEFLTDDPNIVIYWLIDQNTGGF